MVTFQKKKIQVRQKKKFDMATKKKKFRLLLQKRNQMRPPPISSMNAHYKPIVRTQPHYGHHSETESSLVKEVFAGFKVNYGKPLYY